MSAIEVDAIVKTFGDFTAVKGVSFTVGAGGDLRPARPERRRQVDADPDAHDAPAARPRGGPRERLRRRRAGRRGPPLDRRHPPGDDQRPRAERRGEPAHLREALRRSAGEARAAHRRAARGRRADPVARGAGQEPLRRDAAARRDRPRPRPRAADLLPRRADDRPRPRLAGGGLGDAPQDQGRARPDDPAHHPLHGRGRQALRPDRDRGPRRAEGPRFAAQAQGLDPRARTSST